MIARESDGKIASLQHLRGVAALSVVLFHAGGLVGSVKYHGNATIQWLTSGFDLGVDLFFVLSGFVISAPLFLGRSVPTPSAFLANRALRIYPLVITTVLIFGLSGTVFEGDINMGNLLASALLLPSYDDPTPIVLWTLRQEVLFYLVFTITLMNCRIGFFLLTLWGTASAVIASNHWLWGVLFHPNNIQFLLGLATCALCARWRASPSMANIGLACTGVLLLACALLSENLEEVLGGALQPVTVGSLAAVAVGCAYATTLEFGRGLLFLGRASFSIYLIHYFFISAANKVLFPFRHILPDFISLALLVMAGVGGGVGFYLVFERRFEAARKGAVKVTRLEPGSPTPERTR